MERYRRACRHSVRIFGMYGARDPRLQVEVERLARGRIWGNRETPNWRRSLAATAVLIVVMVAVQGSAAGGASRAPVAESHGVALGAYIPEALWRPGRIDSYARLVGRNPVVVSVYIRWPSLPFVRAALEEVWKRGAVPMITWEPWTLADRGFPLQAIAAGRYDRYIRDAAQAAAAWGHPLLVRFAQEMNGNWYPWGAGKAENTPGLYIRAWRHLVGIFRGYHARNVQWVWTPNEDSSGRYPFQVFYPGDRWVDWVGLDGYNWGSAGEWNSFTAVFASSYNSLTRLTSRPVIITETGSSQTGGDKAAWVTSALRREIPKFIGLRAVVWFDARFNGVVDARVNSSRAALEAFRRAAGTPQYALTRSELLATPHSLGRAIAAPPVPSGGFGEPSVFVRIIHKLHGKYLWYSSGVLIAGCLGLLVAGVLMRRRLRQRGNGAVV
jgi:hypothetical protein